MFFIPGWFVSLFTFPGVIVHELAHKLFCDLAGVPVYEVCYFKRGGNPAGYVIHGPVNGLRSSFLISIGPLIVNTVLCSLLTFSASLPLVVLKAQFYNPVFPLLMWVGFSIGMHAFPSNQDSANFLEQVKQSKGDGLLLVFAKLFSGLLKVANALRMVWIDAIYAFCVTMFLPWVLGAS